jgi:hypothetical protein
LLIETLPTPDEFLYYKKGKDEAKQEKVSKRESRPTKMGAMFMDEFNAGVALVIQYADGDTKLLKETKQALKQVELAYNSMTTVLQKILKKTE